MVSTFRFSCMLIPAMIGFGLCPVSGQAKKTSGTPAFYSGAYRNLFLEAGYSQAEIDKKVDKAFYDIFTGPGQYKKIKAFTGPGGNGGYCVINKQGK